MTDSETDRTDHIGTRHTTDVEVQAYVQIGGDGLGDFQFGLVSGSIG